jgi:hypothetical protein
MPGFFDYVCSEISFDPPQKTPGRYTATAADV